MGTDRDLSSPIPWRRAQRASDARRIRASRRRRLAFRGRAGLTLAVAASSVAAGGALAHDTTKPPPSTASAASAGARPAGGAAGVAAIQAALGVTADGILGPRTRAAIRRFQRRNGLTVDGIAGPRTRAAIGLSGGAGTGATGAPRAAAPAASANVSATLARIAACESGGDPTAVSADGRYRGKYQFSRETWRRLGGAGDPAQAGEAEQDRLAAKLLAQSGTAPWPTCGG